MCFFGGAPKIPPPPPPPDLTKAQREREAEQAKLAAEEAERKRKGRGSLLNKNTGFLGVTGTADEDLGSGGLF